MGKKILTVFGATGNQGGSVLTTFLEDPKLRDEWHLRGVTRSLTKPNAKELASNGVEMVTADMNDTTSLVKAIQGSHTVFAVTNYWDHLSMPTEIQQGKNMADAAKEAGGVQHYIWSTLMNVTEISSGALPDVYHFDGKALVADHIRSIGLPATFIMLGFYMSNISQGMFFRRQPPDEPNAPFTMELNAPRTAPVPLVDAKADTGKFVAAMVRAREAGKLALNTNVLATVGYTTFGDILDTFAKMFPEEGSKMIFKQISDDEEIQLLKQAHLPDHAALEMMQNIKLLQNPGYFGGASLDESLALVGGANALTSWEDHLKNKEEFKNLR